MPFSKRPLSPSDLLDKLVDQGLEVRDRTQARAYLQHVGGFRLKGYWFHLLDARTKRFQSGLTFEQIVERYEFDR